MNYIMPQGDIEDTEEQQAKTEPEVSKQNHNNDLDDGQQQTEKLSRFSLFRHRKAKAKAASVPKTPDDDSTSSDDDDSTTNSTPKPAINSTPKHIPNSQKPSNQDPDKQESKSHTHPDAEQNENDISSEQSSTDTSSLSDERIAEIQGQITTLATDTVLQLRSEGFRGGIMDLLTHHRVSQAEVDTLNYLLGNYDDASGERLNEINRFIASSAGENGENAPNIVNNILDHIRQESNSPEFNSTYKDFSESLNNIENNVNKINDLVRQVGDKSKIEVDPEKIDEAVEAGIRKCDGTFGIKQGIPPQVSLVFLTPMLIPAGGAVVSGAMLIVLMKVLPKHTKIRKVSHYNRNKKTEVKKDESDYVDLGTDGDGKTTDLGTNSDGRTIDLGTNADNKSKGNSPTTDSAGNSLEGGTNNAGSSLTGKDQENNNEQASKNVVKKQTQQTTITKQSSTNVSTKTNTVNSTTIQQQSQNVGSSTRRLSEKPQIGSSTKGLTKEQQEVAATLPPEFSNIKTPNKNTNETPGETPNKTQNKNRNVNSSDSLSADNKAMVNTI